MQCTKCQYPQTKLSKITHDVNRGIAIRKRICPKCGHKFTTHESLYEKKTNDDRFPHDKKIGSPYV